MLLRDKDTPLFKKWLLPKLETISDAEPEVLADYVIALITANEDEQAVREGCLESLADFLGDHTQAFVQDVIQELRSGGYRGRLAGTPGEPRTAAQARIADAPRLAKAVQPRSSSLRQQINSIPSIVGNATNADYEPRTSRASNTPPANAPTGPASSRPTNGQNPPTGPRNGLPPSQSDAPGFKVKGQGGKKRKQVHQDSNEASNGQDAHYNRTSTGDRPVKQAMRRGLKGAAGASNLRAGAASFEPQNKVPVSAPMPQMANPFSMANLPPPPPGPMPFDVNNPMAFFTMMATLGMNMPGMPPMPSIMPKTNGTNGQAKVGKCHSYHEKGYCARGLLCPFQHGEVEAVPQYDPTQPSLSMQKSTLPNVRNGVNKIYAKGGRPRADLSLAGPTSDRTNTSLVVEQIPPEHCSEDEIRGYFSEFGTIIDVEMHSYKRLAVVKYEDHSAAARAYNSPKAVFENRFVKVYWKRSDMTFEGPGAFPEDTEMDYGYEDEEEVMSPEEIAERQAEAQKAFEERRRKFEETEARAAELDRLLKEKDAEMRKIRKQLAELAGEEANETNANAIKDFSHDLATLQAEAENLFGSAGNSPFIGRGGPGRGGYQGRAYTTYSTRGRGFAPLRGRGAPRGGYAGRGRVAVSVKRLDNRPRRLAVAGIVKGSPRDEALRQYLLGLPECTNIEPHPETADTIVLTFQERYQAESFLDSSRHIPATGPLDLSWIANDAFGGLAPASTTTVRIAPTDDAEVGIDSDDDSSATAEEGEKEANVHVKVEDADMDVADDVDQWL